MVLTKAHIAMAVVLIGCCSNVVFLELLINEAKGMGNLITFTQFFVIALEGFVFTTNFGRKKPAVPMSSWINLVIMYFLVSVTNNWALNFNIPMPLHMIFRAGSLLANMVMGIALLGKTYPPSKYLSVFMISVGIAICTIMSTSQKPAADSSTGEYDYWLFVGIGLLTFALFMAARMGIYQEVIFKKYGKFPKEALFYTHALPLPGFLLLYQDIAHHWTICLNSTPVAVPVIGIQVPVMLLYLLANVMTQYLCISAVFVLTTECTSLAVNLVVTLRKFLSLIFSIWYFQNPFTFTHWIGTFLVFSGTIIFSDIPGMLRNSKADAKDKEKKTT